MNIKLHNKAKAGDYIEFYVSHMGPKDEDNIHTMNDNSSSLKEEIYCVFENCFALSNRRFKYYGPTVYDQEQLKKLLILLSNKLNYLSKLKSGSDFTSFIKEDDPMGCNFTNYFDRDSPDWIKDWKTINQQLIDVNKGLIKIVQEALDQHQYLWVFGI